MDNKQTINAIFYEIWELWKKYGFQQSLDEQEWEFLIRECESIEKKNFSAHPYKRIYRDMFMVLHNYYEGKYKFAEEDSRHKRGKD